MPNLVFAIPPFRGDVQKTLSRTALEPWPAHAD
jgi:hypothetical protein